MYLVGQWRADSPNGSVWDFQGVFSTYDKALAACVGPCYFLAPVELDQALPDEMNQAWEGLEYPK